MKRSWFVIGLGVGFVLGSRAGSRPYERLAAQARDVSARPEVKRGATVIAEKAGDLKDKVTTKVGARLSPDDAPDVGEEIPLDNQME